MRIRWAAGAAGWCIYHQLIAHVYDCFTILDIRTWLLQMSAVVLFLPFSEKRKSLASFLPVLSPRHFFPFLFIDLRRVWYSVLAGIFSTSEEQLSESYLSSSIQDHRVLHLYAIKAAVHDVQNWFQRVHYRLLDICFYNFLHLSFINYHLRNTRQDMPTLPSYDIFITYLGTLVSAYYMYLYIAYCLPSIGISIHLNGFNIIISSCMIYRTISNM